MPERGKTGRKGSVGDILRYLREKRKWSIQEVSEFTGIPGSTIHQYETGKSEVPAERLKTFAKLFGVSIDYLVTGADSAAQFAREHPEHFKILNRAAKELPADRFDQLKELMRCFVENKGNIPGFDWQAIVDRHQRELEEEENGN